MTEQNLTAIEALATFARRHTDDRAVQALVDAATLELAGRTVVRPDQQVAPRRFVLRRRTDVSGISGTGDIADGVQWPDGTASLRWRGPHPKADFCDRGIDTAEFVHGHGGATEIVWLDQDDEPAAAPVPDANPATASLRLRRVVDHALNKAVPCPQCKRSTACGCVADRTESRIDAVLAALAPWLADGTAA
ncbi:hypothetical protein ACWDVX_22740 [Streptomyces tendae]